jgi:AraC-like DNA-binding protein
VSVSVLIRIDQVPADERHDFMRDLLATTWVPMEGRSEHGFRGEVRASGLGPMQVAVMDLMPMTVHRTPRLIEEADPALLKVLLVCGGSPSVVEQNGRQARLSAADFAFYDTRRPYEVIVGTDRDCPTRVMTFMFSPSLLPLSPDRLRRLTATRIQATAGMGDLTSQFLLHLARNIDHYSPSEAARLSTAALEVLATRLAHELDVPDRGTPESRRHALLTTVQAFVEQWLGDPGLSPSMIAAAHHLSLRSLHQLFHDEGLTVASWVRQRRMARCRRDLADPALASRPVAAIAARWGFSSASTFSRAFHAVHGMPPAEYRRLARNAKEPAV